MKIYKYWTVEKQKILIDGVEQVINCYSGSNVSIEEAHLRAREKAEKYNERSLAKSTFLTGLPTLSFPSDRPLRTVLPLLSVPARFPTVSKRSITTRLARGHRPYNRQRLS